ncbi:hypothetical protein SAMN04489733_8043 [Amycolatopsis keratiniphila]|nr:hypothetical protein SAMN04489733_8043 [Amycolatopsis keratiniphila]
MNGPVSEGGGNRGNVGIVQIELWHKSFRASRGVRDGTESAWTNCGRDQVTKCPSGIGQAQKRISELHSSHGTVKSKR